MSPARAAKSDAGPVDARLIVERGLDLAPAAMALQGQRVLVAAVIHDAFHVTRDLAVKVAEPVASS